MNELPVTVRLAPELWAAAAQGTERVRSAVAVELAAVCAELGVDVRPVPQLVVELPPRGHPVWVEVAGRACPVPRELPATALAYVRGSAADSGPRDAGELVVGLGGGAAGPDPVALGELVGLVCRSAVAARPEVLLPPGDPLAAVLRAGGTLADSTPEPAVELLVEPGYLRALTTGWDGGELFAFMRDGLFVELGLRCPPMHAVADPALRPGGFAFRINGVRTLPRVGLAPDAIFVNDLPERLAGFGEPVDGMNPATGQPGAITGAEHRAALEASGRTVWDAFGYFILCLAEALRRRAFALLGPSHVVAMLDQLEKAFPAVVAVGRAHVPDDELLDVQRELLREGVSVRNQRRITELLLRYHELPEEAARADPLSFVRAGLADQIGMVVSAGTGTLVAYLLDPEIEQVLADGGAAAAGERLADAVAAELGRLSRGAGVPRLLVRDSCRVAARDLLRHEFPRLVVLGYADLPPNLSIQPTARISW